MIGTLARACAAAQPAADLDPADALDHPIEQNDVGLHLIDEDQRFFAVAGAGHVVAWPLEVEGDEVRESAVVLDQQQALVSHWEPSGDLAGPIGHVLAGRCIIDHLGDVGRVVADALEVLGHEQQVRGWPMFCGFSIMCVSRVRKIES